MEIIRIKHKKGVYYCRRRLNKSFCTQNCVIFMDFDDFHQKIHIKEKFIIAAGAWKNHFVHKNELFLLILKNFIKNQHKREVYYCRRRLKKTFCTQNVSFLWIWKTLLQKSHKQIGLFCRRRSNKSLCTQNM